MYSQQYEPPKQYFRSSKSRSCTNVPALVIFVLFIGVTLSFVIYYGKSAKFNQLRLPKDDCGNFCGELNDESSLSGLPGCSPQDMQNLPKLLKTSNEKEMCVHQCPSNYTEILDRCIEPGQQISDINDRIDAFIKSWHWILITCFVAFVFSYICLLLYRYFAKYVIWVINIGFIIFSLALATFFTFFMVNFKMGIPLYITGFGSIVVLIIFRKEVALVARIFQEASMALMDVPAIMFEPILTFVSLLISFTIFIFFIILIGVASKTGLDYGQHGSSIFFAHLFNIIAFIWFTQFIFGCQHFIIAGCVSKWFFSRDKTFLGSPISRTFGELLSYHLGSICLGSLLITIVKIIHMIVKGIKKAIEKESDNCCVTCMTGCCVHIVGMLEKLIQYLIRNAYIIVALDGTPFFESGQRAFKLIKNNLSHCYSVNQFGDIVLVVCRFLVTLIAGFVGYEIMGRPGLHEPMFAPFIVAVLFSLLIAHCFVTVFEMTVDTVFICCCIDVQENDGRTKPYFMSDKLKRIMDKFNDKDDTIVGDAQESVPMQSQANYEQGPQQSLYVPPAGYPDPTITQQPGYGQQPLDQIPQQLPVSQQQGYIDPSVPQQPIRKTPEPQGPYVQPQTYGYPQTNEFHQSTKYPQIYDNQQPYVQPQQPFQQAPYQAQQVYPTQSQFDYSQQSYPQGQVPYPAQSQAPYPQQGQAPYPQQQGYGQQAVYGAGYPQQGYQNY
ncbi:unnamed protein product [Chironomus riparius]|uniref:Choline transporter-like protein n=1 Tax=Chironomus riparius TaxID=315576 RepID=A0A9P0JBL8_9DIPT|nr:unnamed protein product [Chironomus riparius]